MLIVGIDPGAAGAVVALRYRTDTGQLDGVEWVADAPIQGGEYQLPSIRWLAHKCKTSPVFIEQQQPMPRHLGGGSIGAFRLGMSWGLWCQALDDAGICPTPVLPRVWKRGLGLVGCDKSGSIDLASRLIPGLELTRPRGRKPTLDGRADAALIALWGARSLLDGLEDRK